MRVSFIFLSRDLDIIQRSGTSHEFGIHLKTWLTSASVPVRRSPRSFYFCSDDQVMRMAGTVVRATDNFFNGFFTDLKNGDVYAFDMWVGADPVLKKLGNDSPNIITVNILKGNGRKSLEGMSSVVLTKQENGQYAVTSAPTSFGIRDGNGTVDWGYNMGGASITKE